MHIYMLTRGILDNVRGFIEGLNQKVLPFKTNDPEFKKKGINAIQLSVRPIQLWEIVFPEEHRDAVLTTLFQGKDKGKPQHKRHNKYIGMIRRMLGKDVEPIPEDWDQSKSLPLVYPPNSVEVVGIGMKPDRYIEGKHEGI